MCPGRGRTSGRGRDAHTECPGRGREVDRGVVMGGVRATEVASVLCGFCSLIGLALPLRREES
jgi:hypothetical protein